MLQNVLAHIMPRPYYQWAGLHNPVIRWPPDQHWVTIIDMALAIWRPGEKSVMKNLEDKITYPTSYCFRYWHCIGHDAKQSTGLVRQRQWHRLWRGHGDACHACDTHIYINRWCERHPGLSRRRVTAPEDRLWPARAWECEWIHPTTPLVPALAPRLFLADGRWRHDAEVRVRCVRR